MSQTLDRGGKGPGLSLTRDPSLETVSPRLRPSISQPQTTLHRLCYKELSLSPSHGGFQFSTATQEEGRGRPQVSVVEALCVQASLPPLPHLERPGVSEPHAANWALAPSLLAKASGWGRSPVVRGFEQSRVPQSW